MTKTRSFKRYLLLFAILAVFIFPPGTVEARLKCRSDPVVILSNGVIMDFSAGISTLPWQVREVHYELHIPAGVSMVLAIHTPTWLTSQETFAVFADQPANQYLISAIVKTTVGNASVSVDAILLSAQHVQLGAYSVSGVENTVLWLPITVG